MEELEEEDVAELPQEEVHVRPRIFEGPWQMPLPADFDAVTIDLDGGVQADLNWTKAREKAKQAIAEGYALMWNIELGLFDRLTQPLANQTQFLSLALSLEHFRDSLWREFKSQTLGLSLFRGKADFSQGFPWDSDQEKNFQGWMQEINADIEQSLEEESFLIHLFCRDVAIEYLKLLASRLPDPLPIYLYLDATTLSPFPIRQIQLLNPECFSHLRLALKGPLLPFDVLGWQEPTPHGYSGSVSTVLSPLHPTSIGVCIPPMNCYHSRCYQGLDEVFQALQERALPFKLIAESHLTFQWEGMDVLFYTPTGLSAQGRRKLQGFCAAGGLVVSTGNRLGFSHEVCLPDWLENLTIAKNSPNSHGND